MENKPKIALICDRNLTDIAFGDYRFTYFSSEDKVNTALWGHYDAAVLIEPVTERAVKQWTGHPHLRYVNDLSELYEELKSLSSGYEIEKKFLIEYPDIDALSSYYPFKAKIEQAYLLSDSGAHRIRKRTAGEVTSYIETLKVRISGQRCLEYQNRLSGEEYYELLKNADPCKHIIKKDRYCFLYRGQYFEMDIYDFWQDRATLELELRDENQPYKLPPEIKVLKDVSSDPRYKNNYLASVTSYEDY